MTEYSPAEVDVNAASSPGPSDAPGLDAPGFLVDLGSLYDFLSRLEDRRDSRGIRYRLVHVLVFVALAKLAGEDRLTGISEWVSHRKEALAKALGLPCPQAPHRTTYSRILGETLEVAELEGALGRFFNGGTADGGTADGGTADGGTADGGTADGGTADGGTADGGTADGGTADGGTADGGTAGGQLVQVAIDGKTLRGSIPAGRTRGVHLMAAYVPREGVVLAQIEVDGKENEIRAAPRLLEAIDLRGKVITADAMLTQRQLSAQVVEAGGEYVWTVKKNQPQLREDIATFFQGGLAGETGASDSGSATFMDKGHGRIEKRVLTASDGLNDYLDWPGAQQVFQLERRFEYIQEGKTTCETVYGITSLGTDQVSPQRLLEIVRTHWEVENGLHYRRDETLREDWCHLRLGHTQRMMAAINNLVLGLLLRRGVRNVPQQRRRYAARWNEALKLITSV